MSKQEKKIVHERVKVPAHGDEKIEEVKSKSAQHLADLRPVC